MSDTKLGRIPPHNIEAEQSLIGSLLIDKEAIVKVGDMVTPEDFYRDVHRMIYEVIAELFSKHEPIDLLSLGNRLEEKKQLEIIGGRSYLVSLANVVPTASNVVHYAQIVQKRATLRRLQSAAGDIEQLVYETEEEVETLLDRAEQTIFGVSQKFIKKNFVPLHQILNEAFDRIDELHREKGKLRGIPTAYADLDSKLGGLQRSDLIILAARPSVGKTSLAMDIARNVGVIAKSSVAVFSLEMSKEQLVDRMICAEAGIDLWKMRTGKLSDRNDGDDFVRIGHAMSKLSEAKIFIDDTASANIMEVRTKCRRLQSEHGLDLVVLDYLQLMEGHRKTTDGRVQEVAEITRGLKAIARELNVPIVALSQLSRAVENDKPAIPKLAHLRESGSIEQDADVVLFLYRKAADRNYRFDELTEEEKNSAELHIAKHRNGPTGVVPLFFDAARASYRSVAPEHMSSSMSPVEAKGGGFDIFNSPF